MVSDVLYEAVREIDRYLADDVFDSVYPEGPIRARIEWLRGEMDAVRDELDRLPEMDAA